MDFSLGREIIFPREEKNISLGGRQACPLCGTHGNMPGRCFPSGLLSNFFPAETCACSGIAVAVHSAQEVGDPKVRHEQAGKGEDGIQAVVADVPEPRQALVVERQAVDEHGD